MFLQIYPRFGGWITQLFKVLHLKQSVLTYLPPIEKPITNCKAIVKMFPGSEQLFKQANKKYTQYQFGCWCNNQEISCTVESIRNWSKVITNLENIHAVMDFLVELDHIYL